MKKELKIKRKLPSGFRKPYVRNSISFRSELYPAEGASRSVMTAGASGSFNIKLMPLVLGLAASLSVCWFTGKIKRKLRRARK